MSIFEYIRFSGGELTIYDTATGRTTRGSNLQVWYKLDRWKKHLDDSIKLKTTLVLGEHKVANRPNTVRKTIPCTAF